MSAAATSATRATAPRITSSWPANTSSSSSVTARRASRARGATSSRVIPTAASDMPASVRRPARPPRGGFGPVDDRSADDGFGLRPDQAGVDLLGPVAGDDVVGPDLAQHRDLVGAAGLLHPRATRAE